MAVTVTAVLAGTSTYIADITATADGDLTTGNIAHGLGAAPLLLAICPLLANAWASVWRVTTADATNLVVEKSNVGGSGVANAQVRVSAMLPHSLVR